MQRQQQKQQKGGPRLSRYAGGTVSGAGEIRHGKTSLIHHDGKGIFEGVPNPFEAVRYHSLAIEKDTVPPDFYVTARTENDIIMGIRHKSQPIEGVQFHPESIMTRHGKQILQNFLDLAGQKPGHKTE